MQNAQRHADGNASLFLQSWRAAVPQNPSNRKKGGLDLPALITHYQFALRVLARLKQAGKPPADRDAFLLGAQGRDLFFFHRVLPWEAGEKLRPARARRCISSAPPGLRGFPGGDRSGKGAGTPPPSELCGGLFLPLRAGSHRPSLCALLAVALRKEQRITASAITPTISESRARSTPSSCGGKPAVLSGISS